MAESDGGQGGRRYGHPAARRSRKGGGKRKKARALPAHDAAR